jgi:hypothetical protein
VPVVKVTAPEATDELARQEESEQAAPAAADAPAPAAPLAEEPKREAPETPDMPPKETTAKTDVLPPMPEINPVPTQPPLLGSKAPLPEPQPPSPGIPTMPPALVAPPAPVVPTDFRPPDSGKPGIAPVAAAVPATKEIVNCPWNLSMKVDQGRTILTATAGKESTFTVVCDRLEMQSPRGSLKAMGDVRITSASLEGTCATLTLNLQGDRVLLEGDVRVKSTRDSQDLELTGDRLNLRIVNGDVAKGSTSNK